MTLNLTGNPVDYQVSGIQQFMQAVGQCARDHGWWENPDRNMGEQIALMHSELSEALEAYRNDEPELWYRTTDHDVKSEVGGGSSGPLNTDGTPAKPEGIASEFADVIIRIFDTCDNQNIPLIEALFNKYQYNLTRPYRHGGKKA